MIKVLVIDDDKLARKGLISIVPWEDCRMAVVGEAANGEKALEFLETNEVDLCVVDIAMPIMTGLEFIGKSKAVYPNMQYIVLSFHEDFDNVQAALRLGTLDYISKMRLDQQDCANVFKHASEIILQNRNQVAARSGRQKAASPKWKEIEQEWLGFYWLFTDEAFEEVSMATYQESPPLKSLEHLLVRLADIARKEYSCKDVPEVPALENTESAVNWIKKLKTLISNCIMEQKNNYSTNFCMFFAVTYIKENFEKSISINSVATEVGLSRSYFASNFKKTVGITFNHYLRRERIKEAKRLLAAGEAYSDVAQMVGYEDEKYFAGLFSEMVGVSPADYAKKYYSK